MKKPVKLIEELVNEFWNMRKKIKDDMMSSDKDDKLWFDYPDYYGLSKKVSNRLSSDFVDSLQGDFFGELLRGGIDRYNKFFKSKRDLNKLINEVWEIYGYAV